MRPVRPVSRQSDAGGRWAVNGALPQPPPGLAWVCVLWAVQSETPHTANSESFSLLSPEEVVRAVRPPGARLPQEMRCFVLII